MNKKYFIEHLHGKDRDTLLYIAGQLEAFDSLWDGCSVSNQKQAGDYDPKAEQSVNVYYDETRGSAWHFSVYSDGRVEVCNLFKWNDEDDETCREGYTMTLVDLLRWARVQPPKVHEFAKPVDITKGTAQ